MKKSVVFLLVLLLLLQHCLLPAMAAEDANLVLASSDTANYKIVCSEAASEVEITAAQTLADYLHRISSAEFEIIRDTSPASDKEILVGRTDRPESAEALHGADLGEDGVCLAAMGKKLVVTGGEKRGALYAVYTLLEDYFGCRWFTSTLTVVPKNSEPTIPANLNYTYVPCFRLRQTYWRFSTTDAEFCVAHKLDSCHTEVPEEMGGVNSEYNVYGCHSLGIIVPQSLFETHPEYFGADENGIRNADMQPCLSNPAVVELGIAYAKDFFATHPDNKVLSISLIDCKNPCQCAECAAFDAAHGAKKSASLLNYVNTVARAIESEYPDCYIATLAYQYAQTPPEGLTVRDNVVIRLCNIGTCVMHDLDDPDCADNVQYNSDMNGWSALTENIYIWNYSTDFEGYYKLHPNVGTMQARFRYFRDHNVIGIFDQGIGENIVPAELHELKTYLSAQLLWNPDTDVERHIREFCAAYYGAAGEDVVKFIELFEKYAHGWNICSNTDGHLGCYGGGFSTRNGTSLNAADIQILNALMRQIKSNLLTEKQMQRITGFELSWRFFKLVVNKDEFNWLSPFADPLEASAQLYDDMNAYGVKYLAESGQIPVGDEYSPNFCTCPIYWFSDMSERAQVFQLQAKFYPVINRLMRHLFPVMRLFNGIFDQSDGRYDLPC